MEKITKDNYMDVIPYEERLNIEQEFKEFSYKFNTTDQCDAALYIFNKYYNIDGIPKDFYLEAMYWISSGLGNI